MRISLLKAPIGGIIGLEMITFVEPLGLECVAGGLLERGHTCQIVDLRIDGQNTGLKKARAFSPDVVGLQCNFTTERYRMLKLLQAVKAELPNAYIVVGGHDASRAPQWFRHQWIDAIAVGDGEEILPDLVDALEGGADPAAVPGLLVKVRGSWKDTGHAPARRNLDDLPLPARHLISEYSDEYYINFRRPLALLETARGCPFKCNFCSVWKFHESSFREKSPARVVAELAAIEQPNIFITDDIFWMNVRRARELAEALKSSGIKKHYTLQTRTDIITRFPDVIEQWKDCGKMTVFLGLEKIDDAGLASVNKSNSAANNERAIEILKDLGVGWTPNFIVDPSWDHQDFDKLKRWIERTGSYNSGFSVLTPLPGTDLWDGVSSEVNTDDWELFDITHAVLPTKLPLEEFYRELAGLWRHCVDIRYSINGRMKTYLGLVYALASGRVTFDALRKGMRMAGMGNVLARPQTFLRAHYQSEHRLREAAELLAQIAEEQAA